MTLYVVGKLVVMAERMLWRRYRLLRSARQNFDPCNQSSGWGQPRISSRKRGIGWRKHLGLTGLLVRDYYGRQNWDFDLTQT